MLVCLTWHAPCETLPGMPRRGAHSEPKNRVRYQPFPLHEQYRNAARGLHGLHASQHGSGSRTLRTRRSLPDRPQRAADRALPAHATRNSPWPACRMRSGNGAPSPCATHRSKPCARLAHDTDEAVRRAVVTRLPAGRTDGVHRRPRPRSAHHRGQPAAARPPRCDARRPDYLVRQHVAQRIPHGSLSRLVQDEDREVRKEVARRLPSFVLARMAADEDPEVRAIAAARMLPDDAARMLDDPDWRVRLGAVERAPLDAIRACVGRRRPGCAGTGHEPVSMTCVPRTRHERLPHRRSHPATARAPNSRPRRRARITAACWKPLAARCPARRSASRSAAAAGIGRAAS